MLRALSASLCAARPPMASLARSRPAAGSLSGAFSRLNLGTTTVAASVSPAMVFVRPFSSKELKHPDYMIKKNKQMWAKQKRAAMELAKPPPPPPGPSVLVSHVQSPVPTPAAPVEPAPLPQDESENTVSASANNLVFAVFDLKGRQFKVTQNDVLMCDRLEGDIGMKVEFDQVLLLGSRDWTAIGRPVIDKSRVLCVIEQHLQSKKILSFKKRRRTSSSKRLKGIRPQHTMLRVLSIDYDVSSLDKVAAKQ